MSDFLPPADRIDLSAVPSSMEQMARRWGGEPTPRAAPERLKPKPRCTEPRFAPSRQARPRPLDDRRDDGGPGFYGTDTPVEAKRAEKDALRSFLRSDTPDPARYAEHVPLEAAQALVGARKTYGAWRFDARTPGDVMKWLRAAGLAYAGQDDDCLTIFARAVRKALIEGDV